MRLKWRPERPNPDWLAAVREENDYLQRFAEHHEGELPNGMMRLIVNLDYAIREGRLLYSPQEEPTARAGLHRRTGGRVYRSG